MAVTGPDYNQADKDAEKLYKKILKVIERAGLKKPTLVHEDGTQKLLTSVVFRSLGVWDANLDLLKYVVKEIVRGDFEDKW